MTAGMITTPAPAGLGYASDPPTLIADLLHLPDGQHFGEAMAPFQREDFAAHFGAAAPPNTWISRPRGGSKTTDTAAIAITDLLLAPDRSRLYAVAADQEQAGLIREAIMSWVASSPALEDVFDIQANLIANPTTGTVLRIMASDAPSALGLLPYRLYLDELTAWPSRAMWDAVISAAHKVPGARVLVISTAGSPAHWSYSLWQHVVESPTWQVRESQELAPWVSGEQVEDQRAHLPSGIIARWLENRWASADEALLSLEDIVACTDHDREPSVAGDGAGPYRIGVDFGWKHDLTGVAVVRGGRRSRVHRLEYLWTRQGSREAPVQVAEVEDKIQSLQRRFRPARVIVDPTQLVGTAQRLPRVEEFPFTAQSVGKLSTVLLSLIRERRLRLLPDEELRTELLSLVVRESTYGWRMEAAPGAHDDRAMALALAAFAAEEAPKSPQIGIWKL